MPPSLPPARRQIAALSALLHRLSAAPDQIDESASALAPQADLDVVLVLRCMRQVQERLDEALAHGRT
jgi:hypothetical protein